MLKLATTAPGWSMGPAVKPPGDRKDAKRHHRGIEGAA
jgi:hypothetical protein